MITLNGYKMKMNKGRGKDTTATTSKPMQMPVLQSVRKQTRGQVEVEIIMEISSHM